MRICLSLLIVVFVTCSASGGDNWPDFRGPGADGHSDSTGLPLELERNEKCQVEGADP